LFSERIVAIFINGTTHSLQIDASLSKKYACQNDRAQLIKRFLNFFITVFRLRELCL